MANADFAVQEKLKSQEREFNVPRVATVVGTGGFGAWAAVFLAKAGIARLVLINPAGIGKRSGTSDDIEGREIAIGPYNDEQLGMAKVDALEEIIRPMRPEIEISKHKLVFDPQQHGDLLEGTVFAGVSNIETMHGIFDVSDRLGLRCYGGIYFGNRAGTFTSVPSGLEIEANAPAWVGSAAMSALLAVNSAVAGDFEVFANISSLGDAGTRAVGQKADC